MLADVEHLSRRAVPNPNLPVILWWTDFMKNEGSVVKCGDTSCYSTNNRAYKNDPLTKVQLDLVILVRCFEYKSCRPLEY